MKPADQGRDLTPVAATGRQIATGAAWLILFKLLDKGIGLVSTLVLVRLLTPADFGLTAMATAVVALTQLMGAFGFDTALIQRQDAGKTHYDTAWTFNVILGIAISILLLFLAVPMSSFYGDERLVDILLVLALGTLIGGFENVGTVAFRKELDFRSEFRFLAIKRIISLFAVLGLAFTLQSYWAMVFGSVFSRIIAVWVSFQIHPYRPNLSLAAKQDLMHFSKWLFLSNLVSFLQTRSTDFILGRTVGSHALGIYNVSNEIAMMPSTELIAPLNRAVYPAYAKLSTDSHGLRRRFIEVFGIICLIGFPVSAVLFGMSELVVRAILGVQWLEAIALIKLFAIAGLLSALASNMYLVLIATGNPRLVTGVSAVVMMLSLPTIVWASLRAGINGAAWAQAFSSMVAFAAIVTVFTRVIGIRPLDLFLAMARPGLCSAVTLGALWTLQEPLTAMMKTVGSIPPLLIGSAAGTLIFVLLSYACWRFAGKPTGPERVVIDFVADIIRHRFRRHARPAGSGDGD